MYVSKTNWLYQCLFYYRKNFEHFDEFKNKRRLMSQKVYLFVTLTVHFFCIFLEDLIYKFLITLCENKTDNPGLCNVNQILSNFNRNLL